MITPNDEEWQFDDDEPEDEDDLYEDCGMMPDGLCMQAGSEWCDWSCPLMAQRARARIAAMKKKS